MTSSKPRWSRPWSEEVTWQAQARETAAALNEEVFLTWLDGDGAESAKLSFKMVWSRSAFVANWLLGDVGLAPGDRAMLVYAPGPEFFVAFVACLRAGVLAVPNYPPDPSSLGRGLRKLDLVRTTCGAEVGLTDSIVRKLRAATSIWHAWPAIRWYNTDGQGADSPAQLFFHRLMSSEQQQQPDDPMLRVSRSLNSKKKNDQGAAAQSFVLHDDVARRSLARVDGGDGDQQENIGGGGGGGGRLDQATDDSIAFLQFTSGSTGCAIEESSKNRFDMPRRDPKGVMISHRNIWHNVNNIYIPGQHNFLGTRIGEAAVNRLHDLAEPSERVVAVSWLPQFHDSGLMLMLLGPFLAG
ncbi:hypothetical protein CTAYLR_007944 [Chrysophaeum taylorii]|uniref:AMP-dependent synthetase/ligase domain-containing protein n=1 Tax=Chrysophaeum taylorii TaxID=2483200 RepID=A0AAD7UNQ5_9STRA|nr:hypothetical protein CTAYLR_007944 [Chrysophaeum taylorii]